MEDPAISSIKTNSKGLSERLKFPLILIAIVIAVIAVYLLWANLLSPEAREQRDLEKKYDQFFQAISDGEEKQKQDIYGGKTPQETVNLFIEALEKDDLELASKYFSLTVEGNVDPKWINALQKAKEEGKIAPIVEALKISVENKEASINPETHAIFETRNTQNELVIDIGLSLNKFSSLWKIVGI
jgi:hypothetical protein